ncbi:DUF3037 domain-containing protein [Photorhabdus caribbeanensis]|uniref:DUF3037 domain-containing protein n=1 Tax=Photorhabdus caribbeanensis TaxID=1004165 RepID=UPI001BD4AFF0|nr:DUF3037 domain-containing protein [Photorhabdus caribbeanensis]MBS9424796.1 DUF3037 domain-containing protein [Photorhabdus caribbeanensis]
MNTPLLYSIVRYAPYAETEEFANVGVIICAPRLGYMVYRLTKTNDARVKNFFKDDTIFHVVKPSIDRELQIATSIISELHSPEKIRDFFYTFTSPKESIFYYSPPRVLLACDCKEELSRLFNKFVKHTEHTKEKREKILARELRERFQSHQELKNIFKKETVGGELTRFSMPLVAMKNKDVLCAIKPLAFTQEEPSKMLEHCDTWVSRIKRAASENILNMKTVLFTIDHRRKPGLAEQKAIDEIRKTLDFSEIFHLSHDDEKSIIEFAKHSI